MKFTKPIIFGISFALLGGLGIGGILSARNEAKVVKADGPVTISNLDEFKVVFDKGASYNSRDIELTADIDISSWLGNVDNGEGRTCGMAGTYTGTFNGNGHILYGGANTGGADHGVLFHFVTGTVKDLVFDCSNNASAVGSLAYGANGTFKNVTIINRSNACNTVGGFGRVCEGGTFENCNVHFVLSGGANTLHFAATTGSGPASVVNCYYSTSDGQGITANGATKVTLNNTLERDLTISVNENVPLGGIYGLPASYAIDDGTKASIANGVVTGLAAGSTTITATLATSPVDYTADFANVLETINLTVEEGVSPVSNVELDQEQVDLYAGQSITITASLTGRGYLSVDWTCTNNTNFEMEENAQNELEVTITAISEGTTTITVEVVSTNSVNFTDSAVINCLATTPFEIFFAVKDGFTNLGADGVGVILFHGSLSNPASAELVTTNVKMKIGDVITTVFRAEFQLEAIGITNTASNNCFMQLCGKINTGARWGVGNTEISGASNFANGVFYTITDWSKGDSTYTKLGSAENFKAAKSFYETNVNRAEGTNSICAITTDQTALGNLISAYGELSNDVRSVLDLFYEVSNAGKEITSTFGETMEYLTNFYNNVYANHGILAIVGNNNYALIILLSTIVVVIAFGAFIVIRRRRLAK